MFACLCCENKTLAEAPNGTYDVCPVCYWEDDPVQSADPSYRGGANAVSLNEARANYRNFAASDRRFVANVRGPSVQERSTGTG